MDDLYAPDGGGEATRWKRRHAVPDPEPQPYKRPICVHFPIKMFVAISKMAHENGLSFTAQVVGLCKKALGWEQA